MFAQESVMDIKKLKAEFEKLKYIEEKLEHLNFDEHLGCYVEKNNGMPVGLAAWVNGAFYGFEQAAKAQAVPEGFVLLDKHQLAQLMANMDSFGKKALGDDYVSFADIAKVLDEAQEPSNNVTPELVNNAVTYVIELQGYEAIEYARVTLNKKGYKTWDYTDKDSIDDTDIYVLCVCPSTPNDSALVKGTFKGIHQGKFTYIQSDLESCPDAQEPAND